MVAFALIAEGVTDQAVLETVIEAWYEGVADGDVSVNSLQPARDATDASRAAAFGGWELVLDYCSLGERITHALAVNDYLIIQIDTDSCEHKNFDIRLTDKGIEKDVRDLVFEVRDLIIEKIGENTFHEIAGRVLFAICVHSIECWMIPLHSTNANDLSRKANCHSHLARILGRKKANISKQCSVYLKLSSAFRKKKNIIKSAVYCESLSIFLSELPVLDL